MSKILITGGTGFLGKHLQQKLQTRLKEHKIACVGSKHIDLLDKHDTVETIRIMQPDIILHMAALLGGIKANKERPADFVHQNMDMASNIFHAALASGCKTVYTIGSVCAYPKHCPVPFKEEDLWNGFPEETNSGYGCAKRMLLMLQQAYRQQHGIGGAHFLVVNLYGEYDDFDLETCHVIPALIKKCLHAKSNNLPSVSVWGSGEATREFLYAGDCAEALVSAIEQNLDCETPINLGVGKDISIHDLANLIKQLTGYTGEMVFDGGLNGQPKRLLDVSKAKKLFGFEAKTDFHTGLKNVIDWYVKQ